MILFDYERACRLMDEEGIDILIPNSLVNAGYLSDYWKHGIHSATVGPYHMMVDGGPYLLIVGLPRERNKEPFITCRMGAEDWQMVQEDVWIKDKRLWAPGVWFNAMTRSIGSPLAHQKCYEGPIEAVVDALKDRGLENSTIGVEMRFLGVLHFEKLKKSLPKAKFKDALPLFERLRMVKTEEEIRRIKFAANAVDRAAQEVFNSIREGITGLDLERILAIAQLKQGVRHEWSHVAIGPAGIHKQSPDSTPIRRGELIRLDMGASFLYYQTDISRVAIFEEAGSEIIRAHEAALNAFESVCDAVKPEVKCSSLFNIGDSILREKGYMNFLHLVGHGLGRDVHEYPLLSATDHTLLEPGMVFTVEIAITPKDVGCMALEEELLVTKDGCELMSKGKGELHITR